MKRRPMAAPAQPTTRDALLKLIETYGRERHFSGQIDCLKNPTASEISAQAANRYFEMIEVMVDHTSGAPEALEWLSIDTNGSCWVPDRFVIVKYRDVVSLVISDKHSSWCPLGNFATVEEAKRAAEVINGALGSFEQQVGN